jgi:hypothetical protein
MTGRRCNFQTQTTRNMISNDAASEEAVSEIEVPSGRFRPEPQGMYCAVARGRSVGIFTSWPEAEAATVRFPRARHHRFGTREEAMQWLQDEAQFMEEKAEIETAAERQMREFNESYQARMRKVMSSEQSFVSFDTEPWAGQGGMQHLESQREGAPQDEHPTQRSAVSAARGAVQGQGGEHGGPGLDSRGRVPTSIAAGSATTPLSAVSFAASGADAGRQGGVPSAATEGDPRGDRGTAYSGEASTRGKVMSAGELKALSHQGDSGHPPANHHQSTYDRGRDDMSGPSGSDDSLVTAAMRRVRDTYGYGVNQSRHYDLVETVERRSREALQRQRQELGLEPRNSASGPDGIRWIPEPGNRSLQEPLRLVIGEPPPWKDKVLETVDYGTKADCPAHWPFLTHQQERMVEELGISRAVVGRNGPFLYAEGVDFHAKRRHHSRYI